MVPQYVDDIFIYSSSPRSLYLNPEAPDWFTINEKYKPILDLIDGKNDELVIYNHISRFYNDEKDVLIPQIKLLLSTSGVFKHNQTTDSVVVKHRVAAPKSIYLTLTDSCNLKCVYCYATERQKHEDATFETWKRYVTDIINFAGKPVFTFTGGEPLLIPYLFELASYTKERGCENYLLTNGTLINTEEIADEIASLFGIVKVSLDTLDESVEKDLRGGGVIDKARKAIKLLYSRKCNVQIMATVTSRTCQNLEAFSSSFDIPVQFQPLYSDIGRARTNTDLSITGLQYYNALTAGGKFNLLRQYHKTIHTYKNNPYKRCSMANEEISIDADGNVYPCHLFHFEHFVCGNLNDQKVSDIYKNSPVLDELRAIDVDTLPKCKACVFRNFCGGACRARVDINRRGIKGGDDFCEFEQKSILDALLYSFG